MLPVSPAAAGGGSGQVETVDLRTLRAVRVLRPLKLVSGIPSESSSFLLCEDVQPKFSSAHAANTLLYRLANVLVSNQSRDLQPPPNQMESYLVMRLAAAEAPSGAVGLWLKQSQCRFRSRHGTHSHWLTERRQAVNERRCRDESPYIVLAENIYSLVYRNGLEEAQTPWSLEQPHWTRNWPPRIGADLKRLRTLGTPESAPQITKSWTIQSNRCTTLLVFV